MDLTGFVSYLLSGFSLLAGIAIFFGENEYIVPTSGRSLRLPCSFLFWFLALIFWAMAVKIEDDDSII
ncbi:MAG: hypothetical protein BEU00_00735 [Marine Group III euryarchaeote CG-Epi3]|uniref:Uncharacterized protein n=1 Tax=Marine Group III euryarchaeote CG-Epi3 TaxID=1888997 RepID=A0A1J5U364_9ARCH|nr:MAG: hypothetical protein BEU00_00735 [Marine Group III euryarchaeote CG-Epi3]|tara:strand:- start:26 stop:229 length:204 start_codon:yes stop_codon:yes gene_type:complete